MLGAVDSVVGFGLRHWLPLAFNFSPKTQHFLSLFVGLFAFAFEARAQTVEPCDIEMARLTSVQGEVELRHGETAEWHAAELDNMLCVGTTIRTQAFSRAALAFTNDSTLRLDQLTTLTIRPEQEERRSWLDMLTGAIHFFSHRPRSLLIDTPFVNAAAEGTEFLIRLGFDEGHIIVYEGAVLASNDQGELLRGPGDAALLRRGQKPVPEVIVRPRDAVAWALHYPFVLSALADGGEPGAFSAPLHIAINRTREGDYEGALHTLDLAKPDQQNARLETFRAGILLTVGRVGEAEAAIDTALSMTSASDLDTGFALAQRSILHVVRNDRSAALRDADKAVELTGGTSSALIAQSYARQAAFDLEGARDSLRKAVANNPTDALAYARLSEIELSFGDIKKANEAAAEATRLAPDLARTQTVQGFARLAEIDTTAAKQAFSQAIALDSADPLAYLGQGLAKIRDGGLAAGRRDLEIAAGLDPNNALIRSYLGKAYFEEKRAPKDATQFDIAKQLDPNDPTPYLYDAIRKQSENRPVEALRDLEKAIELNDNRAVYRSRLLMDEDLAVRSSRLGRVYDDLGFEQLALIEGAKSIATDPSNYAGHRLLADTYRSLPRHEIARDSELLVSQLLQPINLNPVQPRLANDGLSFLDDIGPTSIGYADYSPLFVSSGVHLQADGVIGSDDTKAANIIGSALYGRHSLSLGYFDFETDGLRDNNDLSQDTLNLFWQAQLLPSTSVQLELRNFEESKGDRFDRFFADNFSRNLRRYNEDKSLRLGLTHRFGPGAAIIGSYIRNRSENDIALSFADLQSDTDGDLAELRYLKDFDRGNITFGMGYRHADQKSSIAVSGLPPELDNGKEIHRNAYLYGSRNITDNVSLTLGLSGDSFDDSLSEDTINQLNPKAGLIWQLDPKTVLRLAAFRTFQRSLASSQTLEPTNIAGFNQFFFDSASTKSDRFGIGLDRGFDIDKTSDGSELFGGLEISRRDLEVPSLDLATNQSIDVGIKETFGRAYLYWMPSNWAALRAEYQYERSKPDQAAVDLLSFSDVTTHRFPLEGRLFYGNGMFVQARTTYLYQEGIFANSDRVRVDQSDQALVVDGALGYRFPNRFGLVSFEVRNLFNKKFKFEDVDTTNSRISKERQFFLRLRFAL